MASRKLWHVNEFNKINLPDVVGVLSHTSCFSENNGVRVLDLPIFMPGQGWRIPDNICKQFIEPILMAVAHELQYGDLKEHYVYVTIDQKYVEAGNTGRRAGAHSDAYIERVGEQVDVTTENADIIAKQMGEVSHTYIVADVIPTEFFEAAFPITDTKCDGVLKTFDDIAATAPVKTYAPYTLLKLDPFVVHRAAICQENTQRTFMKVSISRHQYNRSGNTQNPMFVYDWPEVQRNKDSRNHPFTA